MSETELAADWDIAAIEKAFLDNCDYDNPPSVSKAWTFIHACRRWLFLRPGSTSGGGYSLQLNVAQVEGEMVRAFKFVEANDTSGSINPYTKFLGVDQSFRG